jgi:hypothetical protein
VTAPCSAAILLTCCCTLADLCLAIHLYRLTSSSSLTPKCAPVQNDSGADIVKTAGGAATALYRLGLSVTALCVHSFVVSVSACPLSQLRHIRVDVYSGTMVMCVVELPGAPQNFVVCSMFWRSYHVGEPPWLLSHCLITNVIICLVCLCIIVRADRMPT